ncbi:hypothetical protein FIBSPDRAFT_842896 [Athelia psychrophila]|uniref:Uncharacterized protein n=1 Tax=Athelia psychrophila TaxID=1759441 RepID=A0A167W0L0_9AGAM|nr:hypothetical protein FIBSPDRAFT_842896 [Fibularhizoctonia sp. CBS 109695]
MSDPPSNLIKQYTAPSDLTATSLNGATKAQCERWIVLLNDAQGQKIIKKTGRVEELKARLADIYEIDRSAPAPEPVAGLPTMDEGIRQLQWDSWGALGQEWLETADAGRQFLLCPPSAGRPDTVSPGLLQEIATLLSRIDIQSRRPNDFNPSATDFSNEAIATLMRAAEDGRPSAQFQLREIQSRFSYPTQAHPAALSSYLPNIYPAPASSSHSAPAPHGPIYPPPIYPPPQLPPTSSAFSNEAAFLGNISEEIVALGRADGIREAIAQVKSGRIQVLRDSYGPRTKAEHGMYRKAQVQWESMKNIVSRRERLYTQLTQHFGGNEANFWAFFTIPEANRGRHELRSMCLVVEAISGMEDSLKKERCRVQYHTAGGEYSDVLWKSIWEEKNDWEVWRALGLETYRK